MALIAFHLFCYCISFHYFMLVKGCEQMNILLSNEVLSRTPPKQIFKDRNRISVTYPVLAEMDKVTITLKTIILINSN